MHHWIIGSLEIPLEIPLDTFSGHFFREWIFSWNFPRDFRTQLPEASHVHGNVQAVAQRIATSFNNVTNETEQCSKPCLWISCQDCQVYQCGKVGKVNT